MNVMKKKQILMPGDLIVSIIHLSAWSSTSDLFTSGIRENTVMMIVSPLQGEIDDYTSYNAAFVLTSCGRLVKANIVYSENVELLASGKNA